VKVLRDKAMLQDQQGVLYRLFYNLLHAFLVMEVDAIAKSLLKKA